jgi:enterochelin esterase family protein
MVVVTTLGYGTSQGPAGGRTPENITGYTKALLDEVMPRVDKGYHVGRNREQRAIAGLSMGGAETLYVGLNHLDTFAWIGAFSSAPSLWPAIMEDAAARTAAAGPTAPGAGRGAGRGGQPQPPSAPDLFAKTFPDLSAADNARIRMLWIVCGTADGLIEQNRQFKAWLQTKDVNFTELEVPDVGHVWPLWRQNVADMLPRLFRRS